MPGRRPYWLKAPPEREVPFTVVVKARLDPPEGDRAGTLGSAESPESKLGKFTIAAVFHPAIDTPGTGGWPLVPLPAPPGPGYGEIPLREFGSDPFPVPAFAAPVPSPVIPLPGPFPWPKPAPPTETPSPGLLPPECDMAIDPGVAFPGTPRAEPGWLETITPFPPPVPPA